MKTRWMIFMYGRLLIWTYWKLTEHESNTTFQSEALLFWFENVTAMSESNINTQYLYPHNMLELLKKKRKKKAPLYS